MRCPFCGHEDTQVKDSRSSEDGAAIRRRRSCPSCDSRFTTFERVQLRDLTVVKRNGQKRPFDRDKLARSLEVSVRKRPVEVSQVEAVTNEIVRKLETTADGEVTTEQIGEYVMNALADLDKVAYIRFASVYKDFREPSDFEEFVDKIKK